MKKMKRGIVLSTMLCLLQWGTTAYANTWSGNWCNSCGFQDYLDFDIGYRWDKFAVETTQWAETSGLFSNVLLDTRHVNSIQFGASGLRSLPCTNWYVRASGHYSKVLGHHGKYREDSPILIGTNFQALKGDVRGHNWDFNGAIGYLFDVNCCWGFAPVVGWSYDELNWRIKHVKDQFNTSYGNHFLKNRFNGPFIGVDSIFCINPCTRLELGYELHWAMWKLHERLPGSFTQHMKSNNVWANVFRAEGTYTIYGCWNLGLELKYQIWRTVGTDNEWNATDFRNTGVSNRSTSLPQVEEHIAFNMSWNSFSALLKLGRSF